MKTFAPKSLRGGDLRGLLDDLLVSPAQAAQFLHVTERSVWRWLADGSCPWPVLALLWHETSRGREAVALDVGNELAIYRGLSHAQEAQVKQATQRIDYLARLGDFGAANEPLFSWPVAAALIKRVKQYPQCEGGNFAEDPNANTAPSVQAFAEGLFLWPLQK